MSRTEIRRARKHDVSAILGLLYELGRPGPRNADERDTFGDAINGYITNREKGILVAADGREIAGVASFAFLSRLNRTTQEMHIQELAVSKEWQRRGLGGRLLSECVGMARNAGCHRVRLESAETRTGSHAFYKSMGFDRYALSFKMDI